MSYVLNVAYLLVVLFLSPWLLYKALTTGKYRRGLWNKLSGSITLSPCHPVTLSPCHPVAWFHGVSVGEIHLLRQVVARFRQRHPNWDCVISTTTDTGYDEACKRFPDLPVFYWPLDFTWAVRRALRRVNPGLVVLVEGELWPNFIHAAKKAGALVAVINGRMSPRSFRRYGLLRPLLRRVFASIDCFVVQTEAYASCYRALGAQPDRVTVAGSVKYDGVMIDRHNPRTQELARILQVAKDDLIWIAGSTQAPEEEIALDIYHRAKGAHPNLRLFLVPRQRERFDEVAGLLKRSSHPFVRRSQLTGPLSDRTAVVLMDTIGDLGALWGLADVAFVGGSLDGRRGGQNMIEPAAYGAAVLFGPHVWNFRDTADRLEAAGAAIRVVDAAELGSAVKRLVDTPAERQRLGTAAQRFVLSQQGATERTMGCLDRLLSRCLPNSIAA